MAKKKLPAAAPPPPEIGYASEKPRTCFWCQVAPAVQLDLRPAMPCQPIFCTIACAAAYAHDQFTTHGIHWCHRCGSWGDPGGICPTCLDAAQARAAVAASANDRLAAKESEAAHG